MLMFVNQKEEISMKNSFIIRDELSLWYIMNSYSSDFDPDNDINYIYPDPHEDLCT